jgi:hypothetical protein
MVNLPSAPVVATSGTAYGLEAASVDLPESIDPHDLYPRPGDRLPTRLDHAAPKRAFGRER